MLTQDWQLRRELTPESCPRLPHTTNEYHTWFTTHQSNAVSLKLQCKIETVKRGDSSVGLHMLCKHQDPEFEFQPDVEF